MWDMKPDAPAEIRGEFQPIATSRARRAALRAPAAPGQADAPLHADPLGAPQRQQRPRGGGLRRADRPRPRRRHRRDRRPARTTTRRSARWSACCRPPAAPVVPLRVDALHHPGGRGRAAAAGLLRRLARPERTTRCSCCSDPNAPDFGMPELTLAGRRRPRALRRPQAPGRRPRLGAAGPAATGGSRTWTASRPGRSTC